MAESVIICSYTMVVAATLARYRRKVQKQRVNRAKCLREMRQA